MTEEIINKDITAETVGATPQLVNVKHLSELLNLHPQTIAKMAANNEIPYYRIGRDYRFNIKEVMNHFKKN